MPNTRETSQALAIFDPSLYTTQTVREMSAEIIRGQCFVFYIKKSFWFGCEINKF